MIPRAILQKIPGELPKSAREKYTKDLTKLEKIELLEIKEREEKILANKSQISKLPDKGQRIKDFYEKVLIELSQRDEIEKAANLFSELNITSTGQTKLTILEWTGKLQNNLTETVQILDSDDDDEINPLKIIAQSRNLVKTVKYEKPEIPLITPDDIKEIESFSTENSDNIDSEIASIDVNGKCHTNQIYLETKLLLNDSLSTTHDESTNSGDIEPCSLYLFGKDVIDLPEKQKFMPYKTTKNNIHSPAIEKTRKTDGKYWEITAATPPPIRNDGAKLLSLSDSVNIQTEYLNKLKKLQEKHAAERLASREKRSVDKIMLPEESIRKVNKFFDSYRNLDESDVEMVSEDDEVHDEDDNDGSFVNYTVFE